MNPKTYASAIEAIEAFFEAQAPVTIENGTYTASLSLQPANHPVAIHVEVRTERTRLLTVFPIVTSAQLSPLAVLDDLVTSTFQAAFELDSRALLQSFDLAEGRA